MGLVSRHPYRQTAPGPVSGLCRYRTGGRQADLREVIRPRRYQTESIGAGGGQSTGIQRACGDFRSPRGQPSPGPDIVAKWSKAACHCLRSESLPVRAGHDSSGVHAGFFTAPIGTTGREVCHFRRRICAAGTGPHVSRAIVWSLGTDFSMPVFFFEGTEDLSTPMQPAYAYFEQIKAPRKEFVSSRAASTLFRSIAPMNFWRG